MTEKINHKGVVDSVEGDSVRVRILQTSACAACKIAARCTASESKEKLVDVRGVVDASSYRVGDAVVVSATKSVVFRSLMIGFGIPFVCLVAVLVGCMALTGDETLSALASLASLVPCYFAIYLLRHRVCDSVRFELDKL